MARPRSIDDEHLIGALSKVFRQSGYAGASLAELSAVTGLRKASLYHRFPGGKEQMAREVLESAATWFDEHVFQALSAPGSARSRLRTVSKALDDFYMSGRRACLLNVLAVPTEDESPFRIEIKAMLRRLIEAFAALAQEAGAPREIAVSRAERTIALLQGSLVLSRGLGTKSPFQSFLATFADDLLDDTGA